MTPLENLTSAFETLWETKIYLLRTIDGAEDSMQPRLNEVLGKVAAARNDVEKLLIELQERPPVAAVPPPA
ncbi:MAG TPA: hypothetical protein VHD62_03855 [Opitutaceae bacterium]|nr:hypothetical protein [Opitutaceae bacterium]